MFERIKKLFRKEQPKVLRHEMAAVDHTTAAVVFTIMHGAPYVAIIGRGHDAICIQHDMDTDALNDTLIGVIRTIATDKDNKALREALTDLVIDLNQ